MKRILTTAALLLATGSAFKVPTKECKAGPGRRFLNSRLLILTKDAAWEWRWPPS